MIAECAALVGIRLFACLSGQPECIPPALLQEFPKLRHELVAIAEQESGFNPWAIRDETTNESIFPLTREAADREVAKRDAAGHLLGVGMFQITGRNNWRHHGLSLRDLTDPCRNMAAGAAHYADNIRSASRQLYNSGRTGGAPVYAGNVGARRARLAPLLDGTPMPSPSSAPQTAATQAAPSPPLPRVTAFERDGRGTAFARLQSRREPATTTGNAAGNISLSENTR